MAKINTYSTITPAAGDKFLATDVSDTGSDPNGATRNVAVSDLESYLQAQHQAVFDARYATAAHSHARADLPFGMLRRQSPWDASAGTFPGGGAALIGDRYRVSVAGTVDGVAFEVGDYLLAISDNASAATFGGNWERETSGAARYATAAQGALADTAVQPADVANHVTSDTTEAGGGTAIGNIVEITQAAYDALGTPDADTLYVING